MAIFVKPAQHFFQDPNDLDRNHHYRAVQQTRRRNPAGFLFVGELEFEAL